MKQRNIKNRAMLEQMLPIRKKIKDAKTVHIKLPKRFGFRNHDLIDMDTVLKIFNWELEDKPVKIDLTTCSSSDYQALALVVIYSWYLKGRGCKVEHIVDHDNKEGASAMWRLMGALGTFPVLLEPDQQFKGDSFKPLYALRQGNNKKDFRDVIYRIEQYTNAFDIAYTNTLRYVLSELMFNALEHGLTHSNHLDRSVPSIVQMSWYANKDRLQFIIADVGIGIKEHIEQTYPGQESDSEAIKLSIQPEKSGTFANSDPYKSKNNAGMGLFLSSNIIKRLKGDMYIVSGNGLVHISPRDITSKDLENKWNGTFVFLSIKVNSETQYSFESVLQELRLQAETERQNKDNDAKNETYILTVNNHLGDYAEIKEDAIKIRDAYLLPKIAEDKKIILDFNKVKSAPHSVLNALLATPIKQLGIKAYKKIKVINAEKDIRETIDFILEDNTE